VEKRAGSGFVPLQSCLNRQRDSALGGGEGEATQGCLPPR